MYVHGASITTVFPDKESISCKIKKQNFKKLLITGNDTTQEPDNTSKKVNVDNIIDEKKHN